MTHEEAKSVDNHFHRSVLRMKSVPGHNLEHIYEQIDLCDEMNERGQRRASSGWWERTRGRTDTVE
jgi:hypothetical protein